MNKLTKIFSFLILFSPLTHAGEAEIKAALALLMPSAKVDSVTPLKEIPGLYEVSYGNKLIYMSEDGKHLIQGNLIDVLGRKNLTEQKLADGRSQVLAKLNNDSTINFKAENEKHEVAIFTDIDCGYCRKLHAEMDQYLAAGISIKYLFYPRAGKGSESYNKAVSVWCAEDKNQALTEAKQGNTPEQKTCDNPVDNHMKLGNDFEARGTPMIITSKGTVFPGYLPAKRLAKALAAD